MNLNKTAIFLGIILVYSGFLQAQSNIVQNGNFETLATAGWISNANVQNVFSFAGGCSNTPQYPNYNQSSFPWDGNGSNKCFYSQLCYCNNWFPDKDGCGLWFTDLPSSSNYPDAFQGVYNFTPNYTVSEEDVATASGYPVLKAQSGDYYAGFGQAENIITPLTQTVENNTTVQLSFWYSPRGTAFTYTFVAFLHNSTCNCVNSDLNLATITISTSGQTPGTWYQVQTSINTGSSGPKSGYDQLEIGGGPNNFAGGLGDGNYTYIDNVQLIYGNDCCIDHMTYQQTSNLPTNTYCSNYIAAGYNCNSYCGNCYPDDDVYGNVYVLPGQTVNFYAPTIYATNGVNGFFVAQYGCTFNAIPSQCGPEEVNSLPPPYALYWPNIFSPNGDHVNDEYCIQIYGAQQALMQVYNEWGDKIFDNGWVSVVSNPCCLWDGIMNQPGFWGKVYEEKSYCDADGVYYYIITLQNCTSTVSHAGYMQVAGYTCPDGLVHSKPKKDSTQTDSNFVGLYPNPCTGITKLALNQTASDGKTPDNSTVNVKVYDMLGNLVLTTPTKINQVIEINLSTVAKGTYFVKFYVENKLYVKKLVVI